MEITQMDVFVVFFSLNEQIFVFTGLSYALIRFVENVEKLYVSKVDPVRLIISFTIYY